MCYIGDYEAFSYHSYEADELLKPVEHKLDKNIKGLELEINRLYQYDREEIVEEAIIDGVIISYDTMDYAEEDYNAIVSEDGSVDCEIGLQANQERNILRKIDQLNRWGLNPDNFDNRANTSCHIHNNLQYIENNGGNMLEMQRVSEFLLPILYKISGRDTSGYRWARSRFERSGECEIPFQNLLQTARNADNIDYIDTAHAMVCNAEHSNTAEIRIFSNKCNFDRDMIKTYIEFTDHLIELACYMNGRSYVDEFDTLIDWTIDFCNGTRRRRNSLKPFNLNDTLLHMNDLALVDFNNRWNETYGRMEALENNTSASMDTQVREVLRFLRDYETRNDIQLRFDVPTYTYKVDLTSIREELNRRYTTERENL